MKWKDAHKYYETNSSKLSNINRQLCFAGIAIIWIFVTKSSAPKPELLLPKELLIPLKLFVMSLSFDILQYLSATVIWGLYHRYKEASVGRECGFSAPMFFNWPSILFFFAKVFVSIYAYICIFIYINSLIKCN